MTSKEHDIYDLFIAAQKSEYTKVRKKLQFVLYVLIIFKTFLYYQIGFDRKLLAELLVKS